jgi:transposase
MEQLLHRYTRYLEPDSVLIIQNASFHHSERIAHIRRDSSIKLLYLAPYYPDLSPIKEFIAELKAFIKKQWHKFESSPHEGFRAYLEWCIMAVG